MFKARLKTRSCWRCGGLAFLFFFVRIFLPQGHAWKLVWTDLGRTTQISLAIRVFIVQNDDARCSVTLFFRPESVLEQRSPFLLSTVFNSTDWSKVTLWFVSVRLIAYSFGAFCCVTFLGKKAPRVLPNPAEQAIE
jgi:hypothetical protein